MTIESGILLARTLLSVMPKSMPAHVKKSAQKLGRVTDLAQAALTERQRELGTPLDETSREVDGAADLAWGALRDLLDALSRLPDKYERAGKARKLLATIFPEGLAFLRLSYGEQFVMMDTMLKRIDGEGLAKSLDAVVGPELLQEIRTVHPRYQAMVARRLKETGPAKNLIEHVRAIQRTIVEYATSVASTVDDEDPSTIAPAKEALRPIDNHRELTSSKRPSPEAPSPASPIEPTPAPSGH